MMLLTVLFIIVALGLLGSLLAESLSGQYAAGTLQQLSRQADHAASSGVEWGRGRALSGGVCTTADIQIGEFTVSVSCSAANVTEGAASYWIYDIDAEARHGLYGNRDFVRRSAHGQYSNR